MAAESMTLVEKETNLYCADGTVNLDFKVDGVPLDALVDHKVTEEGVLPKLLHIQNESNVKQLLKFLDDQGLETFRDVGQVSDDDVDMLQDRKRTGVVSVGTFNRFTKLRDIFRRLVQLKRGLPDSATDSTRNHKRETLTIVFDRDIVPEDELDTIHVFEQAKSVVNRFFKDLPSDRLTVPQHSNLQDFQPDPHNIHAAKASDMGIKADPSNNKVPLLLLHNLPCPPENVSGQRRVDVDSLKPAPQSIKTQLQNALDHKGGVLRVLGVSGAGKTRYVCEFSALQPTLVFIGKERLNDKSNTLGRDVVFALTEIARRSNNAKVVYGSPVGKDMKVKENLEDLIKLRRAERRIAEHVLNCLVAARIAVYHHLVALAAARRVTMSPRDWLVGQIYPGEICSGDIFKDLTECLLENLQHTAGIARYNADMCGGLRAVIDEAQVLMAVRGYSSESEWKKRELAVREGLDKMSEGGTKRLSAVKESGSLYTVLADVLANLQGVAPIVSGTGMTMTQFETDSSSHVAKPGGGVTKVIPPALDQAAVTAYVGSYLKLNESDKVALAVLQGRARFSAILVILAMCSSDGNVQEALRVLENGMTKDAGMFPDDIIQSKSSLVPVFKAIEAGDKDIKVNVDNKQNTESTGAKRDVRAIFQRMVVTNLLTGKPQFSKDDGALNLIERGLCLLDRVGDSAKLQAKLAEPLVLAAAVHQMDLVASAENTMAGVSGFASALGFTWEYALAFVTHGRFSNVEAFEEDVIVKLLGRVMLGKLTADGRFSGTCTIPKRVSLGKFGNQLGDMVTWLEACCAAVKNSRALPSWVFLPEEAAGPDLAFWLQINGKFHLVLLQAKFKNNVNAHDAYRSVIPESCYAQKSTGKNAKYKIPAKHSALNSRIVAAVREGEAVSSVIRMIVAYPAPLVNLSTSFPAPVCEVVENECRPHEDVEDLLIVIRGGKGETNNLATFFTDSHLSFIEKVKKAEQSA